MPDLSIVVTFHERFELLRLCLEQLEATVPKDAELIVVLSNADGREVNVAVPSQRARCIRIQDDTGYAAAANAGARAASGDLLVFVDYDLIVQDGWLENLLATHLQSPAIGATGCQIIDPHTGRLLDFGVGFTNYNAPHPHMDRPLGSSVVSQSRQVQAFCTAGCVIHRDLFQRVGGFNEQLASLYTDLDFCLRLKDYDRQCWVAAGAVAYHFGGDLSYLDRRHRASHFKADVKAKFAAENRDRINIDMPQFYLESWRHVGRVRPGTEYVACVVMSVVDPGWYVDVMKAFVTIADTITIEARERDASVVPLYPSLGYDLMTQRSPLLYLVDRFVSVQDNVAWWRRRDHTNDLVADRNGNIVKIRDLVG